MLAGCQQERVRTVQIAEEPEAGPTLELPVEPAATAPDPGAAGAPPLAVAEGAGAAAIAPTRVPLQNPTLIQPESRNPGSEESETPKGVAATQLEKMSPEERPTFRQNRSNLDPSGPAYPFLQEPAEAMAEFPVDRYGQIDWVATLDSGLIEPRTSLLNDRPMQLRTDEIIMKNTEAMPWVLFPHRQHTEWLACSNCHPKPFKEQSGANQITMDSIMRGNHCGQCHEKVSFSIMQCERCHSVLHPGSPRAWW